MSQSLPRTRFFQHFVRYFTFHQSRIFNQPRIATLMMLALMFASIGSSAVENGGSNLQASHDIRIVLSPASVVLQAGTKQSFSANLSNTPNTGVSWKASAGTISSQGVFTAPAVATTIIVTVTSLADPGKTATAVVTVTAPSVAASRHLEITTSRVPDATSGEVYSTKFSASGGETPYRWELVSSPLPTGLSLDATKGLISGTTTDAGSFAFKLKVTDSAGYSTSRSLRLDISQARHAQDSNYDGPAELPRVYLQTAVADTPSLGSIVKVNSEGDLKNALLAAVCGDTIELAAGRTFAGEFILPAKPCDDSHWITLRTSAPDASLPPEGTRITPCYAGVQTLHAMSLNCSSTTKAMAKIVGFPPLLAGPGSNHYRLIGLELTQIPGQFAYSILDISDSADHIIADRCWVHGTSTDNSQLGVRFNSSYLALVDSFVSDIHFVETDSQAVGGPAGTGPYKIVDNYLEAGGENIMFGGSRSATVPADIEIRRNHIIKPTSWFPGFPDYAGTKWTVKDLIELKNAQRVLVEGNVIENITGTPIVLTPKNQSGEGGRNLCPVCAVSDITIRYNIIQHAAVAMGIANVRSDNGGVAVGLWDLSIHDDLFDDISRVKWDIGSSSWMFYLGACARCQPIHDVALTHLTIVSNNNSFLYFGSNNPIRTLAYTNNIMQNGQWGAAGCGPSGLSTLHACAPAATFTGNVIVGGNSSTLPASNSFPSDWGAVDFQNFANGDGGNYQLRSSSPYIGPTPPGADIVTLNSLTAGVSPW
jgi:hypothetical protein